MQPVLSLCLPTNGVVEWVFPVLDSIYSQNVNTDLFEVVVTDNGHNEEFFSLMNHYAKDHANLIYKKTDAYMFHNQLESLKLASGQYLKLINHRAILTPGSIDEMVNIVKKNLAEKPIMYFSNGVLKSNCILNNFDEFVCTLGKFASWTTGVGIWKDEYDNLPLNIKIDKISPHSCILFSNRNGSRYIINNFVFSEEIKTDSSKKGTYDLFKAFGVEELTITQNLFIDGDISASTLKKVKNDYRKFVANLYYDFIIRKKPCSYDLTGFEDAMGIYFNKYDIIINAYLTGFVRLFKKLKGGKIK